MKKKLKKYPDGGLLPTYTTGTPEYNAYLEKQKQYEANQSRHSYATTSGYIDSGFADSSQVSAITPRIANVDPNTTKYKVYSYDPAKGSPVASDSEFFDSVTGKYYVPYYDSPGEATIVKSQADLDAEKKAAENEAFKSQYQGYIINQVPIQQEDGTWITTTEASPYPVGKEVPTDGTFHTQLPAGAIVKQMAIGGKLGSYIGDGTKMLGDTLLSTIGLSDVIGDQAYKNQGMADASRTAETIGKYTGQIGATIIGGPIAGMAVSQGQKVLNNIDGEDQFRQHMDQISSLQQQGALGKFNNGAYSMNPNFNTANAIATGAGEIGNILANPGTISNIKDSMSNFNLPTFPFGGNIPLETRRKQNAFTLRSNKYGDQNYFDYSRQDLIDLGVDVDLPYSGQTEKVGLFDSIKYASQINKNTRDSGRDVARVKLNAFVDRKPEPIPSFKIGGNITKYPDGGNFVEYNGPTHEDGGISVNQQGMPMQQQSMQQPTAEVEGGESMHDDGIDKYVFSDRLMLDPKSKITFADESKKINRKYKDVKDKFQKQAREMELNRLKQSQEQFKATISQGQNTQQSVQPQMAVGGPITPYSSEFLDNPNNVIPLRKIPENLNLGNDFELNSFSTFNTPSPWIGSQEDYNMLNLQRDPNKIYIDPIDEIAPPIEDYTIQTEDSIYQQLKRQEEAKKQEELNNSVKEGKLPQDTINPLGYAASNIGNVYDLFQSAKPAKANNFGRVDLERINLDAQRKELSKQAGLAKATNRENVRSLATSSGQALGNQVIGNALANSTLGSGLSESYLTEATANNQIGNQEKMTNFQVKQNEILANQMDQAKRQSTTSQALHSVGANTQGYTRDLKSAKVGNENNQLWFDAINGNSKYTQLGFDSNGKMVIQLKDGKVITQP